MQKSLDQWLASLNQHKIDLGLDRVKTVLSRSPFNEITTPIITVGGTNGKGSTVTALGTLIETNQQRVGVFTSPHLFNYNERIQINGRPAQDNEIVAAFEAIEVIRADTPLSYFEFSLLAALWIFHHHSVDYMVLEVGLGGRLDAVNALQSDLSIITTVDIDHSHWLGDDIETIAAEKAAIMRSGCVMIYGDANCPVAIKKRALDEDVRLLQWQIDFNATVHPTSFDYQCDKKRFNDLTMPLMLGDFQIRNFSTALTAFLQFEPEVKQAVIDQALKQWRIPGRIQCLQTAPQVIADVAHNRQSVQALIDWLDHNPIQGHTRAVFSVLKDKQAETWLSAINKHIDHWFIFAMEGERATDIQSLKKQMADAGCMLSVCENGQTAYQQAVGTSRKKDRVIVFGSFHVLDEVFQDSQILFNSQ
ncbi:bifunctional folylpolyglutamate synthase/dihydrofolate synthase [Marinicella gelatinilytica]|uniref:bifunctional folylpolyglutamate synthase/dihydrofolate synthase n=1 Tax=Marinicella gelatinilytica TaxID=2996017 RepID=UPI002260F8A1|nr:folylpolyglutamate synthase/dihydrofolate synthase family protein [Marinicella gelatinilytica]MCX7546051.1 bifunctional folylpolyglutamate synthase/dihydrofolate synthase [Marinicella gelatinilytica]